MSDCPFYIEIYVFSFGLFVLIFDFKKKSNLIVKTLILLMICSRIRRKKKGKTMRKNGRKDKGDGWMVNRAFHFSSEN